MKLSRSYIKKIVITSVLVSFFGSAYAAVDCTNTGVTWVPQLECEALMALYNTGMVTRTVNVIFSTWDVVVNTWLSAWWNRLSRDNCPDGDSSASYYDGICGNKVSWSTITTAELLNAYTYAYSLWVTNRASVKEADLTWYVTRSQIAKMMSVYTIKALKKEVNTGTMCSFTDLKNESVESRQYITLACQLGIMGVGKSVFDPNGFLTRAQFGTILSRSLRGDSNNGGKLYYEKHLQALKKAWIISSLTNPERVKELRWWVMLMLYRTKTLK